MSFKNLLIFTALCHFCDFVFGLNGTQLVKNHGVRLCPYTNFCLTKAPKTVPNTSYQSCCFPCFCDDDCWELDNCCPDKKELAISPVILPCKRAEVKSTSLYAWRSKSRHFRVIDSCPLSEQNVTLRRKCSGDERTNIEDYIWVSSKNSGRIFQNIYCAKCHGVEAFFMWQVNTSCQEILKATFDNAKEILMFDECGIINTVPEVHKDLAAKFECYDPVIDIHECNQAVSEVNIDEDIVTACERNSWPLIHNDGQGTTVYKNVFCLICNLGMDAEVEGICKLYDPMHSTGQKFSALIDFYRQKLDDPLAKVFACPINKVLDRYLGQCRELICPIGKAPRYGRCEAIFSDFTGTCFDVIFYLEVLWNKTTLLVDKRMKSHSPDHSEQVYGQFRKYFGREMEKCDIKHSKLRMTHNRMSKSDYIAFFNIYVNNKCLLDILLQNVDNIVGKVITLKIDGTGVFEIFVKLDGKTSFHDTYGDLDSTFVHFSSSNTLCYHVVRIKTDKFCPKFELRLEEAELFSAKQTKERSLYLSFFETVEVRNETAIKNVCVADYFSVMALSSSRAYSHAKPSGFFVAFVYFLLQIDV